MQTDLLGSWDRIVDGNRNVVQSCHFDPWGRWSSGPSQRGTGCFEHQAASDWTLAQDGSNLAFRRGFTGHEHYDRFGIINMNARLYDPVLGRFFSPDPQIQNPFSTQGFNRYSYCGNNPVMYVDEDGEFAWFIPLIAAAVGGVVNVAVNAVNGNLSGYDFWTTVGKGAAAFFAGAAQGASACFGPGWMAAGGALAGGVNSWLGGGNFLAGAVTGSITSAFGGMAGQWASRGANVLINGFNITSPVISGVVAGGTAGAAAGFASGFVASGISSGWEPSTMLQRGWNGALSGGIMGGFAGGVSAYAYATEHNINPWTGRPDKSITIGEGMTSDPRKGWFGIDKISKDLGTETFDGQMFPPSELMHENEIWIESKIEESYVIYDRGYVGNNSSYYQMELPHTANYNNVYHVRVLYVNQKQTIRIYYIK